MTIGGSIGRFAGGAYGFAHYGKYGATVGGYLGEKAGDAYEQYIRQTPKRIRRYKYLLDNYKRPGLPPARRKIPMEVDEDRVVMKPRRKHPMPRTPKRRNPKNLFNVSRGTPRRTPRRTPRKRKHRSRSGKKKDLGLLPSAWKGKTVNKKKKKFAKTKKASFHKDGATLYNSTGQTVFNKVGVTVGHGTSILGTVNALAAAVVRKLFAKIGIQIENWYDIISNDIEHAAIPSVSLVSLQIITQWWTVAGAVAGNQYVRKVPVDTTKTYIALADALGADWYNAASGAGGYVFEQDILRVALTDDDSTFAATNRGQSKHATINFQNMLITNKMVSKLKFLNATQSGANINTNVTDVRIHPLQVRAFQPSGWCNGVGYNLRTKTNAAAGTSVNTALFMANTEGTLTNYNAVAGGISNSIDFDKGMTTLLDGHVFTPKCSTGDHMIEPGEEHCDTLVFETTMNFAKFWRKLFTPFAAGIGTPYWPANYGKLRFFQFKRNLTPYPAPVSDADVTVDWQIQQWYSCSIKAKPTFLATANYGSNYSPDLTEGAIVRP